jgi:two-component system, NtrC family, sensor kinase
MMPAATAAEKKLLLFQAVLRAVNSSLILEDIFDALGAVLCDFITFDSATIAILDDTLNSVHLVVQFQPDGRADVRHDQNWFVGYDPVMRDQVSHAQITCLPSPLPTSFLFTNTANHPEAQGIVVPLINKGLLMGVMGVSLPQADETTSVLLEAIAEQLAIAIENAKLYWQTQSQAGREFLINQLTKSIRQSLDIPQILQTTAREIGQVMGISRCVIHYWGQGDLLGPDPLEIDYLMPGTPALSNKTGLIRFERARFESRSDAAGQFNPFVLNDTRDFPSQQALFEEELIKSLAIFPIVLSNGKLVGTVSLHQCNVYRTWLPEDLALLGGIAEHLALALSQAQLFHETESQRLALKQALDELQQAQIQLIQSEKMAVLGQFVAGIAHEVNTPLGTLMANDDTVRVCLEKLTPEDPKQNEYKYMALELLGINAMACQRISDIVKNLRNFARLDESDLKWANLHEGIDATLQLIHPSVKHRITFEKDYSDMPDVQCFPGLLNQVFMNMLVNATHAMEQGGRVRIHTRVHPESGTITVAIEDEGKGIAPEHLSRIFDPGFTTKGVGVGTGLGLALCYKIVEKHHGRIDVASVVGQGTTMTVTLPIQQPKEEKAGD